MAAQYKLLVVGEPRSRIHTKILVAVLCKYVLIISIFYLVVFLFVVTSTINMDVPCKNHTNITIDNTSYHAKKFYPRVHSIEFLILHFTAASFKSSVNMLTGNYTSVHYLVKDTNSRHIYQLVNENKSAWHAGVSAWQNYTNLNEYSIGIENVNLGAVNFTQRWHPFPDQQISALIELAKMIVEKHKIRADRILGHSDISPTRKSDPGPAFPWHTLYEHGIGAWYDHETVDELEPLVNLTNIRYIQGRFKQYGYNITESGVIDRTTEAVVKAFQMHFRPSDYTGKLDTRTVAILEALLHKYLK